MGKIIGQSLLKYVTLIFFKFKESFIPRKIDSWTQEFQSQFELKYVVSYRRKPEAILDNLANRYGTDKGSNLMNSKFYSWKPHTYTDVYEDLFRGCRYGVESLFEMGIGSSNTAIPDNMGENARVGASLFMWRDFFPNAKIIGADLDLNSLFSDERIQTFYVDQQDSVSIKKMVSQIGNTLFDIIIDDGLHSFEAGVNLFDNLFDKLKINGTYVIEDVTEGNLRKFMRYFDSKPVDVRYINCFRGEVPVWDNNLVVIRHSSNVEI